MDIAKIRKKARPQGQEKKAEERPAATAEVLETAVEAVPDAPQETEPIPEEIWGIADKGGADKPAVAEAVSTESSDEETHITELLTFSLDKEEFAFRVSEVEEIVRFQRITVLPSVPDYVSGITSLRGKIIPVIDLKKRLALNIKSSGESAYTGSSGDNDFDDAKGKIIVLSGPRGLIGAIIDMVNGVVRLPNEMILEPPPHLTEEETRFIEGVVIIDKRFISIIRSEDALDIEVG
jgi:purine-binding chemotaxis protein CheW